MTAAEVLRYIVLPIAGYLIGSLTPGYWIAKAKGVDLRTQGSKNIGATNVVRVLGKKVGLAVFALDVLKGFLPTLLFAAFVGGWPEVMSGQVYFLHGILYGACAILGHTFPIFVGFRGGKAVATGCGVFFALTPYATLLALAVWGVLFLIFRIVSLGSIVAAIVLPVAAFVIAASRGMLTSSWPVVAFATTVAALVILRHRGNIQRVMAGTENKFERKAP